MADSLLDNYNPLYDIHLRQYFALPHMQKHLQKMGLLESTLNLNGDEVYARHHAMMDMMLKNREAQLLKMAELRKKLDAAEKVEICRRIRTGQSPESYRRGKPSRSLSRNRAGQKGNSGGRQRRFSNSYEDRDFVQHIEERNADPDDYDTRDPYKRLSANAKRFNYLHKLDDNTLIAYKDNLKRQLQRLERFREISFGPHSVARQPPPQQSSWFFRRRSVLNMRGRKTTTGNKLNASHDNRTSCPPTTRKRKDSNTRLPPINPQKARVPTKPPAPVSLQQTTTKLPPAVKKPAPSRGRPSNKRQTTTTTTTAITAVSKSPPTAISVNTFPTLPSVTGHGIFTGAAAAATVAAIGTAAITVENLISDEPKKTPTPSPPVSPVLETQKTFDRSSPTDGLPTEEPPADILEHLAHESEQVPEHDEQEFDDHIERQIVLDNAPINHSHGDYEDSDSEPEYAEEDRETPEEHFVRHEIGIVNATPSPTEPLEVQTQAHDAHVSPPISDKSGSPPELRYDQHIASEPESPYARSETEDHQSPAPPSPVLSEKDVAKSPALPSPAPQSPVAAQSPSVQSEHEPIAVSGPQSPVLSVHSSHASEHIEHSSDVPQSPALSVRSSRASEHHEHHEPTMQSPAASEKSVASSFIESTHEAAVPQSPALSVRSSHVSDHFERPADVPQSPASSVRSSHVSDHFERLADVPQSPASSIRSSHASEHLEHHDQVLTSPVPSEKDVAASFTHDSEIVGHEVAAPQSPVNSEKDTFVSRSSPIQESELPPVSHSPAASIHSSNVSEHFEHHTEVPQSPALSVHSSRSSEHHHTSQILEHHAGEAEQNPILSVHGTQVVEHFEQHDATPQSPVLSVHGSHGLSEHREEDEIDHASHSPVLSVHSYHASEHVEPLVSAAPAPHSPVLSVHSSHASENFEQQSDVPQSPAPSMHSSHVSEHFEKEHLESTFASPGFEDNSVAPQSPGNISHVSEHFDHHPTAPESPVLSEKDPIAPRSPSIHTSDAEEIGQDEEETFEVQHHIPLSHSPAHSEKQASPAPAAHSPTAMDLYNPSHGNMESPLQSEAEHAVPKSPVVAPTSPSLSVKEDVEIEEPVLLENGIGSVHGIAIADRIDMEAYHNSPTKESTSPVATNPNPAIVPITAEQIAEQLTSPTDGSFEDIINKSADEEASHLIQEALTEAPAIIGMVNTYEERFSPQTSPGKGHAMMTSIYQPSSDHDGSRSSSVEPKTESHTQEWDDGSQHIKETSTHAEFNDGNVHHTFSETVTVITDNGNENGSYSPIHQQESPKSEKLSPNGAADNISTDSLIIHDDHVPSDYQMTQSIYEPNEEVHEKEWDEDNKHVHEVISNMEHTDETGTHYTETVTTTTTVIKSGDDLKNNNDDEDQEEEEDHHDIKSVIEEEEEHGSNGNLVRETITTTTHTVTTGLPEGGILVDDGDETNVSSL
ncbi:unnamed protein product [Caenorhabditis sp. 36 PRJEB53466]|nr:unnamed protein product [Caenorhabditis sp. 36 PRJEB53466]